MNIELFLLYYTICNNWPVNVLNLNIYIVYVLDRYDIWNRCLIVRVNYIPLYYNVYKALKTFADQFVWVTLYYILICQRQTIIVWFSLKCYYATVHVSIYSKIVSRISLWIFIVLYSLSIRYPYSRDLSTYSVLLLQYIWVYIILGCNIMCIFRTDVKLKFRIVIPASNSMEYYYCIILYIMYSCTIMCLQRTR